MQDKNEYFLKAKKSLGQHFLRSEKALLDMINALDSEILSQEIFEIGPGEGVLTEKLLEKFDKVTVLEIDQRSVELLEKKFAKEISAKKLKIVNKDCLEVDYFALTPVGKEYTLVGNIPYYITGAIFRHSLEQKVLPKQIVFLVQKEVAQRIVASDGKESLLSVSVKIYTQQKIDTKIISIVKKGSFVPPPKVDSAIISINNILSPFRKGGSEEVFFKILRASFAHKRKLMLSNLKTDLSEDLFLKYFTKVSEIIIPLYGDNCRAEDVSIDTWKKIISII